MLAVCTFIIGLQKKKKVSVHTQLYHEKQKKKIDLFNISKDTNDKGTIVKSLFIQLNCLKF